MIRLCARLGRAMVRTRARVYNGYSEEATRTRKKIDFLLFCMWFASCNNFYLKKKKKYKNLV